MPQEAAEACDAVVKVGVVWLHLAAEPGHDGHGRVERVFVDLAAILPDEAQHTVQPSGLEHGPCLSAADSLQHLHNGTKIIN